MGRMVNGKWMSEDEILAADPDAGPARERFDTAMQELLEEMRTPMNRFNFRERLHRRLQNPE